MSGSTNFQQWNPTSANQENDSQFMSDAQRVGGAPNGVPFPSQTGNKLFYQVSTGITALMQMMAAKGYTVNDTNIATLASTLAAIQTTADSRSPSQVLFGSTGAISLNAAQYSGFEIHLSGSVTITFTGQTAGQVIPMAFFQPSGGGCTATISAAVGEVWIDTTANAQSSMEFFVVSDNSLRAIAPAISGSGINATPIGQASVAAGSFAALIAGASTLNTLSVTGASSYGGNAVASGSWQAVVFYAAEGGQFSGHSFTGDSNTGLFSPAAGQVRLACSGTTGVLLTSSAITFSLPTTFSAAANLSAGGSMAGNFSGSPNFTGSPTSTVPSASDNSTRIPTTSWVQSLFAALGFAFVSGNPGYVKLPSILGGFLLQWGTTGNLGGGSANPTFPLTFNNCWGVQATAYSGGSADFMYVTALTVSGFTVHDDGGGAECMWIAYGF